MPLRSSALAGTATVSTASSVRTTGARSVSASSKRLPLRGTATWGETEYGCFNQMALHLLQGNQPGVLRHLPQLREMNHGYKGKEEVGRSGQVVA